MGRFPAGGAARPYQRATKAQRYRGREVRKAHDALGLTALSSYLLADSRTAKNGWHDVGGLLRQSVYGRFTGYEDVNDAARLIFGWIPGYLSHANQSTPGKVNLLEPTDNFKIATRVVSWCRCNADKDFSTRWRPCSIAGQTLESADSAV